MEVDGAEWSWVHGLVIPFVFLYFTMLRVSMIKLSRNTSCCPDPAVLLQKRRSQRFRNIHRKAPMLESLFNKVVGLLGLQPCNLIKKLLQHRRFPANIAKFFRKGILTEHLWATVSVSFLRS